MKMIIAIVSNDDSSKVQSGLTKAGYFATKLATTGGFLMAGNTTFLIGTEDEKVDRAIEIIGEFSKQRTQMVPSSSCLLYTSSPCSGRPRRRQSQNTARRETTGQAAWPSP